MTKVKFISFVPWVTIGSVIGSLFIVPMMPKIVDALYYKNKYNNESIYCFQKYIDSSYTIKVAMPSGNSKYFLLLLSGKNKMKALYPFIHRCCSRFTYPWAWFPVLNCKHYKMCLF